MKTALAVALLLYGMSTTAPSAEPKQLEKTSRRDFLWTRAGKIGFLPGIYDSEDAQDLLSFQYFPSSGEYVLPRQETVMFALSHGVRPEVFDGVERRKTAYAPTFFCIQIVLEYDTPPSTKVYLYRNSNWVRPTDSKFDGEDVDSYSFTDKSISEFIEFHKSNDDKKLAEFDQKFMKWHAQVTPQSETTWKYRFSWTNVDQNLGSNTTMKNYLMRFTPLPPNQAKTLMTFSAKVSNVKKLTVRTFAPAYKDAPDLFDNQLVITFK